MVAFLSAFGFLAAASTSHVPVHAFGTKALKVFARYRHRSLASAISSAKLALLSGICSRVVTVGPRGLSFDGPGGSGMFSWRTFCLRLLHALAERRKF